MSCKFKQIVNQEQSKHIQGSVFVANDTVANLIDRVAVHMLNKKAQEKSKTFLKNKIISLQIDSVKQVYQNRPIVPNNLVEELSPRHGVRQCLRPMSAQVKHETEKRHSKNFVNESKRTIMSHSSFGSVLRLRPNTASTTTHIQSQNKKRRYQQRPFSSNEKKFFAIKTNFDNDDSIDQRFIEQLRARKFQQEEQMKKKQQFLKSIQFENKNFTQTQAKFMQTMSRKKFIYSQQGEIIEISKNVGSGTHLKKISAIAKSRVQVKQRPGNEIKRLQQQLKENIYIEFKGRQGFDTRPQTATHKQPTINIKAQLQKSPTQIDITKKQQLQTKQQVRTNNFLTVNTIKVSKPQQQKSQTSLKNIMKSPTNTFLKSPQQTRTQLDMDEDNLQVQQKKKKQQKIFFYPSVNSVYRVIDDFHGYQGDMGNEDSFN